MSDKADKVDRTNKVDKVEKVGNKEENLDEFDDNELKNIFSKGISKNSK